MKKVSFSLGLFLTVVMLVTIFAGCAAAPEAEAPEQGNITYRAVMLADATGPYAVTVGPQLDGAKHFAQWAKENDYLPGIDLEIVTYDHGLKMESCVALYKEAVTSSPSPVITNGGLWSTAAPTLAGLAKQHKIPILDTTPLKECIVPPGWFFGYQPTYEGQVGAYINWIVDNWKPDSKIPWIQKHYENRKPRLALFSWDITLGRANETNEVKCYAASKGVEWAGAEYVPMTVGDVTPQLTRLKDNVDFIYVGMFGSAWQAVLKKAAEMGMRDQFIDIGPSYFSPAEICKFTPDLANNNGCLSIFLVSYDEFPQYIKDGQARTSYPVEFGSYAVGWHWGDLVTECIRQTMKRVGDDKVDGQAVYDMLCDGGLNKFKPMVASNTISFSNNSKLVKMAGGDTVNIHVLSGYDPKKIEPKDCAKAFISTWDVTVPALMPGEKDVPAGCE